MVALFENISFWIFFILSELILKKGYAYSMLSLVKGWSEDLWKLILNLRWKDFKLEPLTSWDLYDLSYAWLANGSWWNWFQLRVESYSNAIGTCQKQAVASNYPLPSLLPIVNKSFQLLTEHCTCCCSLLYCVNFEALICWLTPAFTDIDILLMSQAEFSPDKGI